MMEGPSFASTLSVAAAPTAAVAAATSGLEQAGRIKRGDTVLVTAAAGGTGQFAVQLAKVAGCRVIGTCGGDTKAALLKSLGVDRVVNYHKESLKVRVALQMQFIAYPWVSFQEFPFSVV
jgi:NADPH-dependent curcumin reductase CurA